MSERIRRKSDPKVRDHEVRPPWDEIEARVEVEGEATKRGIRTRIKWGRLAPLDALSLVAIVSILALTIMGLAGLFSRAPP